MVCNQIKKERQARADAAAAGEDARSVRAERLAAAEAALHASKDAQVWPRLAS